MKKVLFIFGGPRRKGNLAKMMEVAVKEAEKLNYESCYINLYDKNIALCRGCMKCKESTKCVINDDIHEIREKLMECDLVVIASPTYFANVSAPVKNMFDRLVGAIMDDNENMIPKPRFSSKQQYVLMTTCNTPWPFDRIAKQSTGCIKAMKEFFNISGMKFKGEAIFAGTRDKNELPHTLEDKIKKLMH